MTTFVTGAAGSGKSRFVTERIVGDLKAGKKVILLVPEQQAVIAENALTDAAKGIPTVELEVLNFSRLANRVFRSFGGLSYHYIGRGAKALIMWRALSSVAPMLGEYRGVSLSDAGVLHRLLDLMSEFKSFRIRPSQLEKAAGNLRDRSLKKKLADLSLIYAAYESILMEGYDDPEDDLTRLADLLDEHDFFSDYTVYIDSFYSFTPAEYAVLRRIMEQSPALFITCCIEEGNDSPQFDTPRRTFARLTTMAKVCGRMGEEIVLGQTPRFSSPTLTYLSHSMFAYGCPPLEGGTGTQDVSIVSCPDLYAEAEFAARTVLEGVRHGDRYRDFVLAAREIEDYRGVIDAVFRKYDIPLFLSQKTDLCDFPLYRLILSALAILQYGWQTGDVITYLKTGLCGLSLAECDALEDYLYTWSIAGRGWTGDEAWTANPDGYRAELSESGQARLDEVNRLRLVLREPLMRLGEAIQPEATVRAVCFALYDFLAREPLLIRERIAPDDDESILVYNSFSDTLDQLVAAAGDMTVTPDVFSQLFSMIASDTDFGRIPAAVDEVTAGSAGHLRCGSVKHILLLGMNDGVFPRAAADPTLLSDAEREKLREIGLELEFGEEKRASDELLYFYQTALSASDSVTLTYPTAGLSGKRLSPSSICERLCDILPGLHTTDSAALGADFLLQTEKTASEAVKLLRGTHAGEALRRIYASREDGEALLKKLEIPVSQVENRLSPETVRSLYPSALTLSQSRLESYALCGFSYCCKYTLGLEEKRKADFRPTDSGTFMHHILEAFLSWYYSADNPLGRDLPDEEIEKQIAMIVQDYVRGITRGGQTTKRFDRLVGKLRRTSVMLIKNLMREFAQSRFVPCGFEMPVGFGEGAVRPLEIPLADGSHAYIYGVIDRADVFQKDGHAYVRVVDYKTGSKEFSLSDIRLGINLQLLLYLFSIWKNKDPHTLSALGLRKEETSDILPAGVLYFSAKTPEIHAGDSPDAEEALRRADAEISRNGLLLDDPDVLAAMEADLAGRYIPVRMKNDGAWNSAAPVITLESFGSLYRQIVDITARLGTDIKCGRHDARPLNNRKYNACQYCSMKPVCRILPENAR